MSSRLRVLRLRRHVILIGAALTALLSAAVTGGQDAAAAPATVGLGTAQSFAVLGGSTVTNTGSTVITGDLGVSPGSAITGFPPGTVSGSIHTADSVAAQAQADTTTAYNDAAGRSPTATITSDLGGQTLVSGVYRGATLGLTGTLTLNAQGNQSAVFIFQAASTLITASNSRVALINGAQTCNVFWQVGSSATLGTGTDFAGTVLALTSVTADTGASDVGRLLARNGAVTLDTNTITRSTCAAPTPTTSPSANVSPSPTARATSTANATVTPTRRPSTGGGDIDTTGSGGSIPFTGGHAGVLLPLGLLVVAAGTLLVVTGRRAPRYAGQHRR